MIATLYLQLKKYQHKYRTIISKCSVNYFVMVGGIIVGLSKAYTRTQQKFTIHDVRRIFIAASNKRFRIRLARCDTSISEYIGITKTLRYWPQRNYGKVLFIVSLAG